jgi:hypothetical protein
MNRASHALIDVAPDVVAAPSEPADAEDALGFLERARTHLDPLVHGLIQAGISADAVTGVSLALGAFGGVLVAKAHFGAAALAIGAASIGYGSAKAEAMRVTVPGGSMRRAGRAICMVLGTALVPIASAFVDRGYLPAWSREAPIVIALALVGFLANVSAVMRLRAISRALPNAR